RCKQWLNEVPEGTQQGLAIARAEVPADEQPDEVPVLPDFLPIDAPKSARRLDDDFVASRAGTHDQRRQSNWKSPPSTASAAENPRAGVKFSKLQRWAPPIDFLACVSTCRVASVDVH